MVLIISSVHVYAYDARIDLKIADSLFVQKKYSASFDLYKKMLEEKQLFTRQSLMKMAFISDALGNSTETLVYLNFFNEHFPNRSVLKKMEEIADQNKLEGYQYNDLEYFSSLYKKYYIEIMIGLGTLTFLYFLAVVANKIFIKGISNSSPIFFILYGLMLFYFINFGEKYIRRTKAVVVVKDALLMKDPAAGSICVGKINEGTRVTVLERKELWCKIVSGNTLAYIRTASLYQM